MISNDNLSAADLAAVVGNNNDGFGNGNGAWWLLILLIFANNGWGGNGWGGNAGSQMMGYATQADVNNGFNQAAIMSGINGINSSLTNGFANAEISRANTLASITNQINNLGMAQLQNGFNSQLAVANIGAQIASEACADRASVNDGVRDLMAQGVNNTQALLNTINGGIQAITDKLCQQEIDALKTQNANLQTQLNLANLRGSQDAQTAAILAGQVNQTAILEDYLNPVARPAYIVQNPNCCSGYGYNGCGCGN